MDSIQLGESFVGEGVNAAHVNTVFGHRNGPVGTAWATALGSPSEGFVPFVAVLKPSLPVKPMTLFVQKAAAASDFHSNATWGAAQAGIAAGVADAVAEGIIPEGTTESHALIAAVWVNPSTDDLDAVYRNNREAARRALELGANNGPAVEDVVAARNSPSNPFYTPSKEVADNVAR
jgi:5,6,7,8-tetrahydromethanopterin hydro-lyase